MKKIISSLLLGLCLISYSQNEGAFFYFNNNGGIRFDQCTGNENAVFDGQSAASNDQILVGVSNTTISDSDGNLLFYSDGLNVYNKNHELLPNGTGLQGKGSSLILPLPNSDHLYYLFTVDNSAWWNASSNSALSGIDDGNNNGLEYSVIDLNLENGLGDIIPSQKRQQLLTYNPNNIQETDFKCSSKLTAVKSADCSYFWIITHFLDTFYAFKLDENGISTTPVISTTVPQVPLESLYFGNSINPISDLKVSSTGQKIAMTYGNIDVVGDNNASPKGLFIYDLDPASGNISNPVNLTIPPELIGFDLIDYFAISLDFSLDGRYLYATTQRDSRDGFDRKPRIWRWNLDNENISSTVQLVFESEDYEGGGSLQLAPNGKLFHVRELLNPNEADALNFTIGVINNPSESLLDDLEYEEFGLALNPGADSTIVATNTLPQYNPQWYDQAITITDNTLNSCQAFICGEQEAILTAPEDSDARYFWYKDDVLIEGANDFFYSASDEGNYRVEVNYLSGDCTYIGIAEVIESNTPPEVQDAIIIQCDGSENDGTASFRLNKYRSEIVLDTREVDIRFFATLIDAENLANQVDGESFVNTSNPQIIYAAVSNLNDGCFSIAEVELRVDRDNSTEQIVIKACDNEEEQDGLSSFNFDTALVELSQNYPEASRITFHDSLEKAQLDQFELQSPYNNNIPYSQVIFARLEAENSCLGIIEVELRIEQPPNIPLFEEVIYCQDIFPTSIELSIGLSSSELSQYSYLWNTGETNSSISINQPGTYSVILDNGTECTIEKTIEVLPSSNPVIENILIEDLGSNNSLEVIVSGDGEYEYSIAGNDFFNENPTFNNLAAGLYNVRVRDKNGCGLSEQLVSISGFPRYFSPNGDGINDTWQIKNLGSRIDFVGPIDIYDRYGKFLFRVSANGQGWDGIYEGKRMPQSDYWFKAQLNTGQTLTGHFALRR